MEYTVIYGFLTALGIGTLIGIERERSFKDGADVAGVRTFILFSLFGAVTALISSNYMPYFLLLGFAGMVFLVGLGYAANVFLSRDRGLTTEISIVLVFLFGFLSFFDASRSIAVMSGITVAVVLAIKENLHEFAREVEKSELFDTLKFLVIAFIILPLLPNETVDPLNILNPHQIWLMVVLISGIGYFGYIMVKVLGAEKGIGVTGFLGGLTSSTAVTTAMASKVKTDKAIIKPAVFATVLASSMMFPRVLVEVFAVNPTLLPSLILPMGVMLVTGLAASFLILHSKTDFQAKVKLESPLALRPALKFGAFFVFILIVSSLSQNYWGNAGTYLTSAIAGLADVDAITLSMATMAKGDLPGEVAVKAIVLATIVNTFMKVVYARIIGTKEFALWVGATLGATIIAGLATLIII